MPLKVTYYWGVNQEIYTRFSTDTKKALVAMERRHQEDKKVPPEDAGMLGQPKGLDQNYQD